MENGHREFWKLFHCQSSCYEIDRIICHVILLPLCVCVCVCVCNGITVYISSSVMELWTILTATI
jgi:hypothetical protein